MPLRDHFHAPLDDEHSWEGFHAGWPMVIVQHLTRRLPRRYVATPRAHLGPLVEIDVGSFEKDEAGPPSVDSGNGNGGVALATAVWAPPRPTFAVPTDLPELDEFAVHVYDTQRGRRLVAAIEIVSPMRTTTTRARKTLPATTIHRKIQNAAKNVPIAVPIP